MKENLINVFGLNKELRFEGAPVIVSGGALQKAEITKRVFAHLKYKIISEEKLSKMEIMLAVRLKGSSAPVLISHKYEELPDSCGGVFGIFDLIPLPDSAASFVPVAMRVLYSDGREWKSQNGEKPSTIPETPSISTLLTDKYQLLAYLKIFGKNARRVAESREDYWVCTCGKSNAHTEEKCSECGAYLDKLLNIDPDALREKGRLIFANKKIEGGTEKELKEALSVLEEAEDSEIKEKLCGLANGKLEEIKAKRDKTKKRTKKALIISAFSVIAVAVVLFVAISAAPLIHYNSGMKALESGDLVVAYGEFGKAGGYSDAEDKAADIVADIEAKATELLESGDFNGAYLTVEPFVNRYDVAFSDEIKVLSYIAKGNYKEAVINFNLKEITIPEGVEEIADMAFYGARGLETVNLPSTLKKIGDEAFYQCTSLKKINLPDGLESIGEKAFYACSSLTEVTLPKSLTSLGRLAYGNTSNLSAVTLKSENIKISATAYPFSGAGKNAQNGITLFVDSAAVPSYLFSNGSISDAANLTRVEFIGDKCKSIGVNSFTYMDSFTDIKIPTSVTSIKANSFYECNNLELECAAKERPNGWAVNWYISCKNVIWDCETPVIYSFVLNGGKEIAPITSTEAIILPTAVRNGYTFEGWYTGSELSGTRYMPGDSYRSSSLNTLYASWKPKAPGTDFYTAFAIPVGTAYGPVRIENGKFTYFSFTVHESGSYTVSVDSATNGKSPTAYLYTADENGENIETVAFKSDTSDIIMTCTLEAGTTYVLAVCFERTSYSTNISCTKN